MTEILKIGMGQLLVEGGELPAVEVRVGGSARRLVLFQSGVP